MRDKCGRQGGDNCKLMRPKAPRVGDKGETSVNSSRMGDKCGRQVWETSGGQVGDQCKLMRPKEPRVGDKGETSVNSPLVSHTYLPLWMSWGA